jgi:hypothetical protein
MDTEMFAPVDIKTAVTTSLAGLKCFDGLTGAAIAVNNNRVSITVPAGGWRLLRFRGAER